nr:MAG TPA: hypothetical protein [Caudoviricetes sp.]
MLQIELTSTGWALIFYNVSQRMMAVRLPT